jgi:hypothetical protein
MYTKRASGDINIYAMKGNNTTQELSYYEKNKERCKEQRKKYNEVNKERLKEYRKKLYRENKECIRSKNKEYLKREDVKQRRRKKWKERYRTDTNFRIESLLRWSLRSALKVKGIYKTKSAFSLIGCSINEFKAYIESQWLPGMSWENHTIRGWHIDHIKPVNTFDLTDIEQQKQCFHYTNLRPLWYIDNVTRPHDGSDIK